MKNPISFRSGQMLLLFAVQFSAAHATVIYSDTEDGASYGTGHSSANDLIVGGATGGNYSGIAIFKLPDLGAGGSISAATLTFTITSAGILDNGTSKPNADIYGLGYQKTTPSLQNIWQLTSDTETRNGNTLGTNLGTDLPTKLVDNAVTSNTMMNLGDTTVVTGAGLVTFLNSLYTTYGAVADDYAIFRVNADGVLWDGGPPPTGTSTNFRYGGSEKGANAAKLELTVIPEPSGILLTAFGATALLLRRRRA